MVKGPSKYPLRTRLKGTETKRGAYGIVSRDTRVVDLFGISHVRGIAYTDIIDRFVRCYVAFFGVVRGLKR